MRYEVFYVHSVLGYSNWFGHSGQTQTVNILLSKAPATCRLSIYCTWFGVRLFFLEREVHFTAGWKGPLVGRLNPNSLILFFTCCTQYVNAIIPVSIAFLLHVCG